MSTPELQQILELLQKLGKAQEELNVKVSREAFFHVFVPLRLTQGTAD